MLYRFDVVCGDASVSWVHLAAALMNAEGSSAVVRNDRMIIRRTGWLPADSECTAGMMATRGPGDHAERQFERHCRRSATRVLPIGFAPLNELEARLIRTQPVKTTATAPDRHVSKQDMAVANPPTSQLQQKTPQSAMPPRPAGAARTADDARALTPGYRNPHVSPAERWADPAPLTFPERPQPKQVSVAVLEPKVAVPEPEEVSVGRIEPETVPSPSAANSVASPAANPITNPVSNPVATNDPGPSEVPVDDSTAAKAPLPDVETAAPDANETAVAVAQAEVATGLRLVSTAGWTPSVDRADQRTAPADLQVLNAFSIFTDQVRNLHIEREFVVLLVGLTLLWGLLSGAGWYATRARRRATVIPFSVPEPFSMPEARRPASYPQAYPDPPIGTALIAPADKMMCSELCKTAHAMLRQIETNVDNLQNVAPLRRVLQREMQHLEQFLAAVMTATPIEVEEWRRTRNRLQRIVKELHRLKDIVDGAYRSLSGNGFSGREPPRDKHEAYEMLGVNADISPKTLKKLVDALRACWHPDLAKDESDRLVREERMKRINIAWDILSEKRAEA